MLCLLLGRLARDESVRGTGLGRGLLLHVLSETARLADQVGIFTLLVDALDEEAAGYYRSWDFDVLECNRLFLTVKDIRATLLESGETLENNDDEKNMRLHFTSVLKCGLLCYSN